MATQLLGELIALSTAVCWSFGSILFSYSGRRVGSFTVNIIRIPIAALLLFFTILIFTGNFIPADCSREQLLILILSGFIGLVVGDSCYFKALVILGPRLASLVAASTPIFATIISWIFLDQSLELIDLLGITITVIGIASVTLERNGNTSGAQPGPKLGGYILALCGSLGQAAALVVAKIGMGENLAPLNASFIRMASAALIIWIIASSIGRISNVPKALKDGKALAAMTAAAFIGPFVGVWLALISIQYTKVGIASTLMATTPIMVIPLVMIIHKERPSKRAIAGTVLAVAGVAVLFLH